MPDMTEAEAQFFATGELPPELAQVVEVAPPAAPKPEVPPAAPISDPALDTAEMLRRSLVEEQGRRAAAEARLTEIERQLNERLHPPKVAPDPTTDPLGNMMHQLEQVNGAVASLEQQLTQEQQNNLLKQQFEQFTTSVRTIKEQFEKTTPDFNDAYNHIRAVRTEDLRSVGVPEAEIQKVLLQDELAIAQASLARGKNPAEELYNMAKRYGYAPKTVVGKPLDSLARIAALNKGAEAARSPTRSAPESELTLEGLKDAGNDDLNRVVQDDKLWAKLVGNSSSDIFGGL